MRAASKFEFILKIRGFNSLASCVLLAILSAQAQNTSAAKRTVVCASVPEIKAALLDARPGDRILVSPGTYISPDPDLFKLPDLTVAAWFNGSADGTSSDPIVFASQDSANPAVLSGGAVNRGYAFYLTGDHWMVRNLVFTKAAKGVMLDNANDAHLYGLEVHNIGHEGIHLRDGSSRCVIEKAKVHHTGRETAVWGEAIYIGSDRNKWTTMNKDCNFNRVINSEFGPNVTAEHVDIKEGTLGTLVEHCIFRGTGLGAGPADGFVDAKGNDAIVRNNIGYREGNTNIKNAFQVHKQVEGWGENNTFSHNTLYMDDTAAWVLDAPVGGAVVAFNTRIPEGNLYTGKYTRTDLPQVGDYITWDPWGINVKGDTVYWSGHIWKANFYSIGVMPGSEGDGLKAWEDLGAYGPPLRIRNHPGKTSSHRIENISIPLYRLDGRRINPVLQPEREFTAPLFRW